jgi:hypothetical protein
MNIEVRQSPPSGEPGVSINDGGTATNLKAVSLNLAWPEFATEARISNDGGFASSKTKTVPLAALVDWELDDTIKGLFTKVVYVRFNGSGIDNTKTYSDDIILDTTAPSINSSAAAVTTSGIEVKVDATDDITGVEVIEIDINNKKISKEYSKTVKVSLAEAGMTVSGSSVSKVSVTTLRVRVRDAVNNWTEWNDLALPGGTVVASQNQTAKKTLKMNTKKAVTGKAIAQFVSLKLPKNSKISVKISASSKKVCKVVKTSVRGIKPGICRITVSVKPRTGKAKIKTVSLRVSK